MPTVGSRLELRIDSLAAGGDGVARSGGCVIFVPSTAPGDLVKAEISQAHPRFARAELLGVIQPGPARQPAPCPHAGHCGGCSWLHLRDAEQESARIRIARDALERIARIRELPPLESLASPLTLGYRARARVSYAAGRIGFRSRRSRDVVDIEHCAILDHQTQAAFEELRANPPSGAGEIEIRGFGSRALGLEVGPESFFQPNGAIWASFRDLVVAACGEGELALELYAGVGFFTSAIEKSFSRVVAVERSGSARDLRRNTRARVFELSAEEFAASKLAEHRPDLVLLNPPRAGVHPRVLEAIVRARPPRLVYVSCDAATLARDVARVKDRYRVSRVVVVHSFPQTHHVETLSVLERVDT